MKKLIIFIIAFSLAVPAFAFPLFQTAKTLGQGKYELLGFYSLNHTAPGYHTTGDTYYDPNKLGLGLSYGVNNDLDVFASYSYDSYPNIFSLGDDIQSLMPPGMDFSTIVKSGNTTIFGAKYDLYKQGRDAPFDLAFLAAYEDVWVVSNVGSDFLSYSKDWGQELSGWVFGGIVSCNMDDFSPYLHLAYGTLNTNEYTFPALGGKVPSVAENTVLINIGVEYPLPKNLSVALEYHCENQWWDKTKNSDWTIDTGQSSQSGLSAALKYKF